MADDTLTEDYLRKHTIGEPKPLSGPILIADYDPDWPLQFQAEAGKITAALGPRALQIEHVGSTSVPDLPAKPIIDIVLTVRDSAAEDEYVPALEHAGYELRIREPGWFEHRLMKGSVDRVNLHVFTFGCPEVDRMIAFRDWLRTNRGDRDLYADAKRTLARQNWKYIQNYADAKTSVIQEIMSRANRASQQNTPAAE
jgi:GrpB-like predicted nucleotidyltransferase (UPF0157 family)